MENKLKNMEIRKMIVNAFCTLWGKRKKEKKWDVCTVYKHQI